MSHRHCVLSLSVLAFSAVALSAQAKGASASAGLADLRALNLIVLGNMAGGGDVEGKTFVGGDLSNAATYGIGSSANPGQGFTASTAPTLTVGGSVTGNANINSGPNGATGTSVSPAGATIGGNVGTINLNASGAALLVGGSIGQTNGGSGATIQAGGSLGSNSHPTGAVVQGGLGAAFSAPLSAAIAAQTKALTGDLKALSAALSALTATAGSGFDTKDPNHATLTAVDGGKGYAVIDITAAQLSNSNPYTLFYNIPAAAKGGYLTTIINVTGASNYTFEANPGGSNSAYDPYVIWNFGDATNITFRTELNGSVLAPDATISNSTPIEGSVAVAGFNQGGEVHLGTFAGSSAMLASGAPEPAAWTMMIVGFGVVGRQMRRRRGTLAVA